MRNHRRTIHPLLDTLLILVLSSYLLLGVQEVPLHGDEATTIWMSKDFNTIVLNGDIQAVYYNPPPRRTTEQHLRVITMNASKLGIGTAWATMGMDAADLNDQWVWSPDLNIQWQQENGHMPSAKLLFVSRLSSAFMTMLSITLVLSMARLVLDTIFNDSWIVTAASWGAATLYALNPAVLVNGRRAMFEGGLLLGIALVGWAVFLMFRRWPRLDQQSYAILGVLTGLALITKHSAAFSVTVLYAGLLFSPLLLQQVQPWTRTARHISGIVVATGLALLVMLALTPIWWNAPLHMPATVIEERQEILDLQAALFGKYDSVQDRLEGLWRESITIPPQYYEAPYWADFSGVSKSIQRYEDLHLAGLSNNGWGDLRAWLLGVGLAGLCWQFWRQPLQRPILSVLLLWVGGIIIITLVAVPLSWQRYYLPLQIPLSLLMGAGCGFLLEQGLRFARR